MRNLVWPAVVCAVFVAAALVFLILSLVADSFEYIGAAIVFALLSLPCAILSFRE